MEGQPAGFCEKLPQDMLHIQRIPIAGANV
jgi:hypothetical protein